MQISRTKETAPKCFTPKSLRSWEVFHALRKSKLECKWSKRRLRRKQIKAKLSDDSNVIY